MDVKYPLSYSTMSLLGKCQLQLARKLSGDIGGYVPPVFINGSDRHSAMKEYGDMLMNGYSIIRAKEIIVEKIAASGANSSVWKEISKLSLDLYFDDKVKLETPITSNIDFTGPGESVIAIPDYIRNDGGTILIVDYKGYAMMPDYELQQTLYAAVALALNPDAKRIVSRIFHVPGSRFNRRVLSWDESEFDGLRKQMAWYVKEYISECESIKTPSYRIGQHCSVCRYKTECDRLVAIVPGAKLVNVVSDPDEMAAIVDILTQSLSVYKSAMSFDKETEAEIDAEEKKGKKETRPSDVFRRLEKLGLVETDVLFDRVFSVNTRELSSVMTRFYQREVEYE